jgi:hypothetical protein
MLGVRQDGPLGNGSPIYSYFTRTYLSPTWSNLTPSYYYGIGDQNQLVGSVSVSQQQVSSASIGVTFINSHAWLGALDPGTRGAGGVDLNRLIPSTSGWTLTSATGIDRLGEIVGYGIDPQVDYHKYELAPVPEPSVVAIFVLAGARLVTRRAIDAYRASRM